MKENPLLMLRELGQSIWLDFLSREIITSGKLQQLIEEDGLCGVTSNPAIFKKAIADSADYDEDVRKLVEQGRSTEEIYRNLAVEDIRQAADLLRPIYDQSEGEDGFVSLEVSPHLAYDTMGTITEAQQLWTAVDRPNIFIKVPATKAGLPAISQLIGDGINVNVTLLFGLPRYRRVADAYLDGLEARAKAGFSVDNVTSVASFFLSRIDVMIDPMLEDMIEQGGSNADLAAQLRGRVAIASAKIAYQIFKDIFSSERFRQLEKEGANVQRVLWASTSTKNPKYSDVRYVEALIGPQTINTMPLKTIEAYRDHGKPEVRLEEEVESSHQVLAHLSEVDIGLDRVAQKLEEEGVQKFIDPYDELMAALEEKCERHRVPNVEGMPS